MAALGKPDKPKVVLSDESPAMISDHPFEPKGEWYTLCKYPGCNLAESAHTSTKLPFRYFGDDDVENE